jgi:hypothetical protein
VRRRQLESEASFGCFFQERLLPAFQRVGSVLPPDARPELLPANNLFLRQELAAPGCQRVELVLEELFNRLVHRRQNGEK